MPFVYVDSMILNPQAKLSIFGSDSWADQDLSVYKRAAKQRFLVDYARLVRESNGVGSQPEDNTNRPDSAANELEASASSSAKCTFEAAFQ